MKVVFSVRSEMAFTLLKKLLQNESSLPEIVLREQNAQNVQQLEDAIEFFKADLYIVDQQLEDFESLKQILVQYSCPFVEIKDDVKAVLPLIRERLGLEDQPESKDDIHYELKEKSKVVIQEKVIEKEVIRTAYQAIPSKVIVIGSLYRGAGSTILATNLARMIGERGIDVSYVEHPLIKPYMFDYLQVHRNTDREYFEISREIQSEGLARSKREQWIEHKVKWHIIDSRKPPLPSFTYENMLVLSHAIQSNVIVVDISDRWLDPEIQKFLCLADNIYVCVEPDPIKYDWSIFEHTENNTKEKMIMDYLNNNKNLPHYELVNMKYADGIDTKLWNEMLHQKPIAKVPYISYSDVQKSLYKSKLLYDNGYNDLFEEKLKSIIAKIIPKDFLEIRKKERFSLKNIFQKN